MKTEEQGPAPSNAFLQLMQTHDGGEICNELAEAMRECVTSVALTGKAATIEMKVKFSPAAKGAFGLTFHKPKVKKADQERYASLWFGDDNGNLHRNDPKQHELNLKTVSDPAQTVAPKEVKDPLAIEAKAVGQ